MLKTRSIMIFLITALVLSAAFAGFQAEPAQADEVINFGYVEWPGVTVKTEVARTILHELDYETEMNSYMQEVLFQGMRRGDVDLFMGVWLPTMEVTYREHEEDGYVEPIATNLEEALYSTYVNEEAYEAGVQSMADLHEYGEEFDYTIYGLEPGNDGNIIIQNAIEDSTYNLEDWELVASSTAGMLSEVEGRTSRGEWVAFNGWEPHWMNVAYDVVPLEDPENIWGEADRVLTAQRTGFDEEFPNVYQLMSQIKVETEWQDAWIYEYGYEERPADEVAQEWVANNLDIVEEWVEGVYTADGETPAIEALRASFE